MNISSTTLYYLFSTIAQVLAATTALTAIFLQSRLSDLKSKMIGYGEAIYFRASNKESGYEVMTKLNFGKLYDALSKKNLDVIETIQNELKQEEIKKNITLEERPTGFQYVYNKFIDTRNVSIRIKKLINSTIISLITIIVSIASISIIDFIED